MQGTGNDFIVVNGFAEPQPERFYSLAREICDRHFGVGADGLIWLLPSEEADARMRIFNADGSEAEMCGNGLRCAARYLLDAGLAPHGKLTVATGAGVLTVREAAEGYEADMGIPCLEAARIPVAMPDNRIALEVEGRRLSFFCVSMGNPHAVTFDLFPDDKVFTWLGPLIEKHHAFPNGTNVEFCRLAEGRLDVRVWERGVGATLACGTGACATLTAAASLGLTGREALVHLPGGTLDIRWAKDGHIFLTGPAEVVFEGEYCIK